MPNCPECFGKKWLKTDQKTGDGRRRWRCWRCGCVQDGDRSFVRDGPKTLYIDLEISLSEYYNFGSRVYSGYLSPDGLKREYFIICWAASWVGEEKVHSGCVSAKSAKEWDDKGILLPLWKLMDRADIIAGHNVDGFDVRRANTRFLLGGLEKPCQFRTIDTLKIARSKFAFESNRLDHIATRLGFRPKDDMRLSDWIKITEGDTKTLKKMMEYNKGDVREGKRVLDALLNWADKPVDFGTRTFPFKG